MSLSIKCQANKTPMSAVLRCHRPALTEDVSMIRDDLPLGPNTEIGVSATCPFQNKSHDGTLKSGDNYVSWFTPLFVVVVLRHRARQKAGVTTTHVPASWCTYMASVSVALQADFPLREDGRGFLLLFFKLSLFCLSWILLEMYEFVRIHAFCSRKMDRLVWCGLTPILIIFQ